MKLGFEDYGDHPIQWIRDSKGQQGVAFGSPSKIFQLVD
jgi:hypothetical protein